MRLSVCWNCCQDLWSPGTLLVAFGSITSEEDNCLSLCTEPLVSAAQDLWSDKAAAISFSIADADALLIRSKTFLNQINYKWPPTPTPFSPKSLLMPKDFSFPNPTYRLHPKLDAILACPISCPTWTSMNSTTQSMVWSLLPKRRWMFWIPCALFHPSYPRNSYLI